MMVLVVGFTLLVSVTGSAYSCSGKAPDNWVVVSEKSGTVFGVVYTICAAVEPADYIEEIEEADDDNDYQGTIIFRGGDKYGINVEVYGVWKNHEVDYVKLQELDSKYRSGQDDKIETDFDVDGSYFRSRFYFKPMDYQDHGFQKKMELGAKVDNSGVIKSKPFFLKFKKAWF